MLQVTCSQLLPWCKADFRMGKNILQQHYILYFFSKTILCLLLHLHLLFLFTARGECTPPRTDDSFLLRFLRSRKFHLEAAYKLVSILTVVLILNKADF
jgi:hypothetical protein